MAPASEFLNSPTPVPSKGRVFIASSSTPSPTGGAAYMPRARRVDLYTGQKSSQTYKTIIPGSGPANEATLLHEGGHAISDHSKIGKITMGWAQVGNKGVLSPLISAGAGALTATRRHAVERSGKKTSRLSNFIDKHPYLSAGIATSGGVLAQEGEASVRAAREMVKRYGAKEGLKRSSVLLPAFGTYALQTGINALAGGMAYKKMKQSLKKKEDAQKV